MIGRLFLILVILFVIYVALTTGEDVKNIKRKDAAIRSSIEVILYSSFWAMIFHRIAHRLYNHRLFFLARIISQFSRLLTGIEIHPGAKIGKGLFIDHGMGVVIGETTEIGENCLLYQGVTLGGTGKDKGKRHPTLGDNVMVGAGAKVLGPITIGNNVKVAANAVVLKPIPDNCTAVGVPARVARCAGKKIVEDLDQMTCPDLNLQDIDALKSSVTALHQELSALEDQKTEDK